MRGRLRLPLPTVVAKTEPCETCRLGMAGIPLKHCLTTQLSPDGRPHCLGCHAQDSEFFAAGQR